ncbi:hypothetical protein EZL74_03930 [Flavobacterium silvisoli]|uniref:Tetratricopeptide repeat protein n=1 Tax=Flavobacterium silvisoli TaxID=2529433 RepID=A0A4Q9Z209_9FLAO|nr:hypothetical protein [Flavobacterium silvisoli]TBX70333.1 hypothetical protein EZL74_03930 [Flavobacterium silvisoli]
MKNYTFLFTAITIGFSFNCFAQHNDGVATTAKWGNTVVMSDKMSDKQFKVESYHVEEKINQTFGGSTSTYTVPDMSLVNTNDLGPNNVRVIKPKYVREKTTVVTGNFSNASVKTVGDSKVSPSKTELNTAKPGNSSVKINILNTYERVINKGYKSVEMLKKVADRSFFDDDLVSAAGWYCDLFEMTTDLEPVYYYRYAQSLMAINEVDKANEMKKLFELKDNTKK